MILKSLTILFFVNVWLKIHAAKILAVFPMPSISHQVVFRPITQELARRGHEVTIITPDPAFPKGKTPVNIKEIDVHDISYGVWQEIFVQNYTTDQKFLTFSEIRDGARLLPLMFQKQTQANEIQELLSDRNNEFDLILIEAVVRPALGYSHIFKAPVILVSSLGAIFYNHDIMGSPTHPFLYPTAFHRRIYNLTLTEKFSELYTHYSFEYAFYLNEADENRLLQKTFGPDIPPLHELYNNVDMLFINIHPIWADSQPVPPNVLYIGGIHHIPEKELPQDLKTYLDSSKHGVIYLSFGSNIRANMIPTDKIQIIVKVLSELPYDVLWKWDKNDLPGKSENIRLSKWCPQSDLLRHPNVKLFITQAGLQSTDEAITAGVPLVAIPMLGDQWYNAEKYVKHGIGKKLDIDTFTAEQFKSAVENVIEDDSYRKNIIKLRELMRDQPQPPLQSAVWWAEYVIRHGGAKHLRPSSANISYAQYFEIEVLSVLLLVVSAFLAFITLSIIFSVNILNSIFTGNAKMKTN